MWRNDLFKKPKNNKKMQSISVSYVKCIVYVFKSFK